MDEQDDTTPFAREPWQRLLATGDEGPPETTDARIRKAARRDLAPRGRRWWLPASLAASFVLAVFIVQSQLGTLRVPLRADSEEGAGGAINARLIEREDAAAARPPGEAPAAPGRRAAKAQEAPELDEYGYPEAGIAADSAGAGPRIGGPERELQAATERPEERTAPESSALWDEPAPAAAPPAAPPGTPGADADKLENVVVTGSRRRESEQSTPTTESQFAATKIRPPPYERTPEAWYAYIEKLRTQGRELEAERQLARLEKAHPGWVARYLEERGER